MTTSTSSLSTASQSLRYKPLAPRNLADKLLTILASSFALICVAPLLLVLGYVVIKGFENLSPSLFTLMPEPPPSDGGGIRNAIFGTFTVTVVAMMISVPVGVGGGVIWPNIPGGVHFQNSSVLEPTCCRGFHPLLPVSLFTPQSSPPKSFWVVDTAPSPVESPYPF